MNRKLFAAILAGVMALCLLPTTLFSIAMAEETATPISISTIDQLIAITPTGSYRLTANIDLAGVKWEPLPAFSGTLDGDGYVIRNLSITDTTSENKGLFASIAAGGNVRNLGLEGVNITAGNQAGGIAGTNSGTIEMCYVTGAVSGGEKVGGIAGTNSGTIQNCYSRASVSGKNTLGGLVGSNSGTIATSYSASTVTDSVMNNYLEFNNGYVEIAHSPAYANSETNAFTLEAWFQWVPVGTNTINFIIGKGFEQFEIHTGGDSGIDGLRFIPIRHGTQANNLVPGGYDGDSWIDVHEVLQTGWFHVAAVYWYDSSKGEAYAQVYVNGEAQQLWQKPSPGGKIIPAEPVGTTATLNRKSNPLASNTDAINIGRRTDGGYPFNGKIADVRFWNTARTADQIKGNKDKVLSGNEDGLVGYWKLTEGEGTTAIDSSSTKNNGTLNGNVKRVTAHSDNIQKGGLTGSGTATNCFFDSAIYGTTPGTPPEAKSTDEMKLQSTYSDGWNFNTIWKMGNDGYPAFRGKYTVAVNGGTADQSPVIEGQSVTITANTAPAGQQFKAWTGVEGLVFTGGTGATSATATFTMPAKAVAVTATYENIPSQPPAPPLPGGDDDDAASIDAVKPAGNATPPETTVYNDPSIPRSTIWLSGDGISSTDLLVTQTLSEGNTYDTMLRLAEGEDVFRVYDISLQSGTESTGSPMHITFDLADQYEGQVFTLVHKKADGTYEYFYATADVGGNLVFGPLYSLSPFMLIKGTPLHTPGYEVMDVPKTGDRAAPVLWGGVMLLSAAVLLASYASRKRKGF